MKSQEPPSRESWARLTAGWLPPLPPSPVVKALSADGLQSLIPIGRYAGWGMHRPGATPVFCDLAALDGRPFMLMVAGSTQASTLDSTALKTLARAQDVARRAGLPAAFFWDGPCRIAPAAEETFPDFDAAGVLVAAAAEALHAGNSQFVYSSDPEGPGLWLRTALKECDSGADRFQAGCSRLLSWARGLDALPHALLPEKRSDPRDVMPLVANAEYDTLKVIETLTDDGSLVEYRPRFGRTLICAYARIGGLPLGIVANQRTHVREPGRPIEFGGVIYAASADKGARFVLDCNQNRLPLLFIHDVNGFMVGRDAEISGIIRSGAKMVNAVANSIVPKITLLIGGSYGAGHYAMCGKAYDPLLILSWPTARYAVMGGEQAARTLAQLQIRRAEESGSRLSGDEKEKLQAGVKQRYDAQMDPRYAAARLWVDHIVMPQETRSTLFDALRMAGRARIEGPLKTGVIQT